MKLLRQFFPDYGVRNIGWYYLTQLTNGHLFVMANWVFFLKRHISLKEIGLIDAISILLLILAELPTGAVADLVGKRASLLLAKILTVIGFVITGFASTFPLFLTGTITFFIGWSFQSGALEALAYDSLKEKGKERKYPEVLAKYELIRTISTFALMITGGVLFTLNPRLPWFAGALAELVGLGVILKMTEPKVDSNAFTIKNYLIQMRESLAHLSRDLQPILLTVLGFSLSFLSFQGIVRQNTAEFLGFTGGQFTILFAGANLLGAVTLQRLSHLYTNHKRKLIVTLFGGLSLSFLVMAAAANNLWLGGFVFVINWMFFQMALGFNSIAVNARVLSKYRSSVLSIINSIGQTPYVIMTLFFISVISAEQVWKLHLTLSFSLALLGAYHLFKFATTPNRKTS